MIGMTQIKNPFVLTIFGASGDLAKLKLFPALYDLMAHKHFQAEFCIFGYARSEKTNEEFKKEFSAAIKKHHKGKIDKETLKELLKKVHYVSGQYDSQKDFHRLKKTIQKVTGKKSNTIINYFSVPPIAFKNIIESLGNTKISEHEDLRLILEKPFGENTETATELFHFVARYFKEEQVFLLDHYLGKSAVQSIQTLRHSNRLLNLMMKGPTVSNIQITAAENIGVTSRIGYFDRVGTIKDMVQSHLLQILALIAMSIPISEQPEALHREKYNILSALKFIESKKNIVLGQYEGYKKEKYAPKNSDTETFAALRLFIDRESWYKVPIYIRTGKKLHEKHTYVTVELEKFDFQHKNEDPNRLIFELQPEERLSIRLVNRHRSSSSYQNITTSDSIACVGDDCLPEHAMLILDVLENKRLYFLSFQEIIATWRITDKIVEFIEKHKLKPEIYEDGSHGPKSQNDLTGMDGFRWFDIH